MYLFLRHTLKIHDAVSHLDSQVQGEDQGKMQGGPTNDNNLGTLSNQSANKLKEVPLEWHKRNNFVLRLERLQSTMVQFYDMTQEECNGILKFVIKLDESEIFKGQKMGRVSINLMNRDLDSCVTPKDPKYFSV